MGPLRARAHLSQKTLGSNAGQCNSTPDHDRRPRPPAAARLARRLRRRRREEIRRAREQAERAGLLCALQCAPKRTLVIVFDPADDG
jgi:hypothetical protein